MSTVVFAIARAGDETAVLKVTSDATESSYKVVALCGTEADAREIVNALNG